MNLKKRTVRVFSCNALLVDSGLRQAATVNGLAIGSPSAEDVGTLPGRSTVDYVPGMNPLSDKVPARDKPIPNFYQRSCPDDFPAPRNQQELPNGYAPIVICVRRSPSALMNSGLKLDS
jgi:hypothetical protein